MDLLILEKDLLNLAIQEADADVKRAFINGVEVPSEEATGSVKRKAPVRITRIKVIAAFCVTESLLLKKVKIFFVD